MRVYTDTLEKSRIKEIIEKFKSYSIVNVVLEEEDDEGVCLYIEFFKEILAYDTENIIPFFNEEPTGVGMYRKE